MSYFSSVMISSSRSGDCWISWSKWWRSVNFNYIIFAKQLLLLLMIAVVFVVVGLDKITLDY